MAEDILEGVVDVLAEVRVLLFERFSLAHVDQVPLDSCTPRRRRVNISNGT